MAEYVDNKGFAECLYKIKNYVDTLAGKTATSYTNNVTAASNQYLTTAGMKIALQKIKDYIDTVAESIVTETYITEILADSGFSQEIVSESSKWIGTYDFLVVKPKGFTTSDLALSYDGSTISCQLIQCDGNSNPESNNGQAYKLIVSGTGTTSGNINVFGITNNVSASIGYAVTLKSTSSDYVGIGGASNANSAKWSDLYVDIVTNDDYISKYTLQVSSSDSTIGISEDKKSSTITSLDIDLSSYSGRAANIPVYWYGNSVGSSTITAKLINNSGTTVSTSTFTVSREK